MTQLKLSAVITVFLRAIALVIGMTILAWQLTIRDVGAALLVIGVILTGWGANLSRNLLVFALPWLPAEKSPANSREEALVLPVALLLLGISAVAAMVKARLHWLDLVPWPLVLGAGASALPLLLSWGSRRFATGTKRGPWGDMQP